MKILSRWLADERGATMVEYALLITFVALLTVTVLTMVGTDVFRTFRFLARELRFR